MPFSLDTILTTVIVIAALAFVARPWIYRLLGRKSGSSMACHSEASGACGGGCSNCPVAQAKPHDGF